MSNFVAHQKKVALALEYVEEIKYVMEGWACDRCSIRWLEQYLRNQSDDHFARSY